MASARDTLLDMGFTKEQVDRALEVTGNLGVEPAMEWLLAHCDELNQASNTSESNQDLTNQPSVSSDIVESPPAEAKSLKCNECNKLFKSQAEVEFHAAKSGHTNFSESTEEKKPLTEEEKEQQKKLLEQKIAEKKREREEKEKAEAIEREKNRIRAGKEMVNIKKKMEEDELKKAIEQRKRDKEEDRLARQKIRDQIEADKQARRAKQQQGSETSVGASAPVTVAPVAAPKPAVKKDYNETRIQVRLLNGQSLTQTFGIKEQLSAVRLYVEMNRTDGEGPFSLMTNFPKKIFTSDDYDKPLDNLGLVPSAVLIVTKTT